MSIEKLHNAADIVQLLEGAPISNLMYTIWCSRRDLQAAFDISTQAGQENFLSWYRVSVLREYGLEPQISRQVARLAQREAWLRRVSKRLPSSLRQMGKSLWNKYLARVAIKIAEREGVVSRVSRFLPLGSIRAVLHPEPGVNLVGYAHAELGMGEHVRMSAAAFDVSETNYGVINFEIGVSSRKQAILDHGKILNENKYFVNIFHINADQMLSAYCYLGHQFFLEHYNIGYWAWELSKCPREWLPVTEMIDEIWAPSRFIQSAFAETSSKPVVHMPLCVSLQPFRICPRADFGLPEGRFLFLYVFDFLSYVERKNPFAAIRAFQLAFPDRSCSVGLVIKVMNGDCKNKKWQEMLNLIGHDVRIFVINKTISRSEVLALIHLCDSFLSLHRSEGFGRGPAEAMLLGKPVVVTNYSGNTDFTHSDNSYLVDYQLIPVPGEDYVFTEGQVWADPDVEHAAWHMRRIFADSSSAEKVGLRGKRFIEDHFNPSVIGRRYSDRIRHIMRN